MGVKLKGEAFIRMASALITEDQCHGNMLSSQSDKGIWYSLGGLLGLLCGLVQPTIKMETGLKQFVHAQDYKQLVIR